MKWYITSTLLTTALSRYISVPDSAIGVTGRTLLSKDLFGNQYYLYDWPCVTLSLTFSKSTSLYADLDAGSNHFQVIVHTMDTDNRSSTLISSNTLKGNKRELYLLVDGLDPSLQYKVQLVKRTEASGWLDPIVPVMSVDSVKFYSFAIDDPAALVEPTTPSRRIEFFSDSDSNGFGIEGPPKGLCVGNLKEFENCYAGFPSLLSQNLKAELHVEAWSGKGVPASRAMPTLWDKTVATYSGFDNSWDFSTWIPDIVVVLLGSNDFFTGSLVEPSEDTFISAYAELLQKIRMSYPHKELTKIVVLGGGYPSSIYGKAYAYALKAAEKYQSMFPEDKIDSIMIPEDELLKYPDNYGCLDHRNVEGQKIVADYLTRVLEKMFFFQV